MLTDKQIKKDFKARASKEPDKYYATNALRQLGFERKHCKKCGIYFWSVNHDQDICGDPSCSGGFKFIGKSPAKKELGYVEVWTEFSKLFKKLGYTSIKRYPVTARWREDTDFVQASIYDFQPYVVSGEVRPPANPLVVPQFCLRFNDIDNVGITGAHYTGFVMIGQHAFMPPKEFDQEKYFKDIHEWLVKGIGLKNRDLTFHEDAWAGGGNFGPCMEFFSKGLELGNQVYMLYEQTPKGSKELNLKVLDMGMGHERNAWFSKATPTSYEAVFPTVCRKLYAVTGYKVNKELMQKFLPYSSFLNVDEVENISKVWKEIAKKIGEDPEELKNEIIPLSALYSVGEHTRALLVALCDGALPSNTGGGYNLRVILRRALSFIDKYGWDIDINGLCEEHAIFLKPLFPELMENLEEVKKILSVEKSKYRATKQKSEHIVKQIIEKDVDEKLLIQLYDSNGIPPEMIQEEARRLNKKINVPDNFYAKVAELHEEKEKESKVKEQEDINVEGVPETKALYYDDYLTLENKAKVIRIIGNKVILDRTVAYPASGGQMHDIGAINNQEFIDAVKKGPVIVHVLKEKPNFKEGSEVNVKVNAEQRKQLAAHHTATHIVNAAARKVLGKHINQAGAKKTQEKATLDITHYQSLSEEEEKEIEKTANEIVKDDVKVNTFFMDRAEAEKKYGMGIYQGGAVPGKELRIVEVEGIDVECCGGTHLHSTKEVGAIKIIKSTKISDSIVRIVFTAGKAAEKEEKHETDILKEAAKILKVKPDQVPARVQELFDKWKEARKAVKKDVKIDAGRLNLSSERAFKGDALAETSKILKTQPEHIINTISRFLKELEGMKKELK